MSYFDSDIAELFERWANRTFLITCSAEEHRIVHFCPCLWQQSSGAIQYKKCDILATKTHADVCVDAMCIYTKYKYTCSNTDYV